MFVRMFKHDPEELLVQGRSIVSADPDAKYVFRVAMVNLVLSGMSPVQLSRCGAAGERIITGWVSKAGSVGFESLRAGKQPGRPPGLTPEQKSLVGSIVADDPHDHGYEVWDGKPVSDLIMQKFNVTLKPRACTNLLHELGFSLTGPQTQPSLVREGDDEAREA